MDTLKTGKIVIDNGMSLAGGAAGMGNYSLSLYRGLKEALDDGTAVHLRDYGLIHRLPARWRRLSYLSLLSAAAIPAGLMSGRLYHYTNHYAPLARSSGRSGYVITIHDLAAWTVPEAFSPRYLRYIRPIIRRTAGLADAVITVSGTVREEIIDRLGVPARKVHVCYNTASIDGNGAAAGEGGHVLYVGSIDTHKNVPTLLRAFARLRSDPDLMHLKLVIAGKKRSGYAEVAREVERLRLTRRVLIPGYVEKRRLSELFAGASVLVMPSRYEGFGIPVIEAFARGVPVVASDIPVFREVAGGAALLYGPPERDDLLAEALGEALKNRRTRNDLATRGAARARQFTRESFIGRHIEVYRRVCM